MASQFTSSHSKRFGIGYTGPKCDKNPCLRLIHQVCRRHVGLTPDKCCTCQQHDCGQDITNFHCMRDYRKFKEDECGSFMKTHRYYPLLKNCHRVAGHHYLCHKHYHEESDTTICCKCRFNDNRSHEACFQGDDCSCIGKSYTTRARLSCHEARYHFVCYRHRNAMVCCGCRYQSSLGYLKRELEKTIEAENMMLGQEAEFGCGPLHMCKMRVDCIPGAKHKACLRHSVNSSICCTCHTAKMLVPYNPPEDKKKTCIKCIYSNSVFPHTCGMVEAQGEDEIPCVGEPGWPRMQRPLYYCTHFPKKNHYNCEVHHGMKGLQQCCICRAEFGYRQKGVRAQGQVTSHQTGNKTTVAESGSTMNYTNINFYGQDYTMANNPSQQTMDPSKFTDPIVEMTSGAMTRPALMSPSAEECGYSDRILELRAGNSTLITQEAAAGAVIAYGMFPTYTNNADEAVDLQTKPGVSVDRWYTLDSFFWAKNGFAASAAQVNNEGMASGEYNSTPSRDTRKFRSNIRIPLPGVLRNIGIFGQNLSYHYLWRCGFCVHVQTNASKFHQGAFMVVAIPEAKTKEDWGKALNGRGADARFFTSPVATDYLPEGVALQQLPIFPHQFLNLRTNNSVTLVLPYVNVTPASTTNLHNIWSIYLVPIAKLDYQAGASTTVPITVSICPMSSQFSGLRAAVTSQGVPTFSVPGDGMFSNVLRNPGFPAYPEWERTHSFPLPGRIKNVLEVAMVGTFLCLDQSRSGVGPGVPSSSNGSVYPLAVNVGIGSAAAPGKISELSWDLSTLATVMEGTYLGNLTRMYGMYRGCVKLTYMFCGSAMTTGKILLAYTPPGGTEPTTRQQAMEGTHVVWDIGLQSSVSMTIPFISASQFRSANTSGNIFSYNGYVTAWYQTNVIHPPDAPTTASIAVLASAADDFVLKQPLDTPYYQGPNNPDEFTNSLMSMINSHINSALSLKAPGTTNTPNASVGSTPTQALTSNPAPQTLEIEPVAPTLTAAETGATQAGTASFAARPSGTTFSRAQTDLELLMSRYLFVEDVFLKGERMSGEGDQIIPVCVLDFQSLWKSSNIAKAKFFMATYWRFDLDIVVVPVVNVPPPNAYGPVRFQMMFCPAGSVAPQVDEASWNSTNNPTVIFNQDGYACIRVPFLSLGNYYTTVFDGYGDFNGTANYGRPPTNWIGNIFFRTLYKNGAYGAPGGQTSMEAFMKVYVRPVNVEAYCPRPLVTWKSVANRARSRGRLIVLPESGPSNINHAVPEIEEQGPVDEQGLMDKVKGMMSSSAENFGSAVTDGVLKALGAYSDMRDKSPQMMDWCVSVLKWVIKLISAVTILVRSGADPAIVAAISMSLGIDIMTTDPFDYLKEVIMSNLGFRYVRKQGPLDWVKNFNSVATAAKGLEWFITKLKEFWDWCLQKKAEVVAKVDSPLANFMSLVEEWDSYERDKEKYTEDSIRELAQKIVEAKKMADGDENVTPRVTRCLVKYFEKAQRFLTVSKKRRHEPIGVIFHGRPGCGKSLLTNLIGRGLCKLNNVGEPYSLPPDPKHFDGYAGQLVTIMDDLGQNPDGEDCSMLCQMISTVDFIPPMASLEEKGVKFTSDFVLASTNIDYLAPPTISEPEALFRRFKYDLYVAPRKEYIDEEGRLDVEKALRKCEGHGSVYFSHCTPLICGKALQIVDSRTQNEVTPEALMIKLVRDQREKTSTVNAFEALFQGPGKILRRNEQPKPLPDAVTDCLGPQAPPEVIDFFEQQGYLIPAKIEKQALIRETQKWKRILKGAVIGLGAVAMLAGVVYALSHLWQVNPEGPYSGRSKQPLRAPVRRIVETQGEPDMEFVARLMKTNLVPVVTKKGNFTGLGLCENKMLLPMHAVTDDEKILVCGKEVEIQDFYDLAAPNGLLELTVCELKGVNAFRDIRKFFPDGFSPEKNCILAINSDTYQLAVPVGNVSSYGTINLSGETRLNMATYPYPTKSGFCGGVVVKAGKILALHVGGDGVSGYGAILTRKMFSFEQGGHCSEMVKSGHSINLSRRTKLRPSIYHDIVPGVKEPAVLSDRDERCDCNLEKAMFSKYTGKVDVPAIPEMRVATAHYLEQIRPLMPSNLTEKLTIEEVVYGIEGLEGLDLATSAGFPYVTKGIKKKDLIKDKDISKLIEGLDLYGFQLPYVTYMKDELRKPDKIKAGKTRLIECSSVNDTVFTKQNLGRLFKVFHENPGTVTGSAVGCNPEFHWTKFLHELGEQHYMAFDYKNYDGSLERCWFMELKWLLVQLGYDEEVVTKIVDHVCFSKHLYLDMEYTVEGGMPSGCSGTSIFNSIINNIIIRTLILVTYKGIDLDQVKIISYGDDVLVTYPFPLDPGAIAQTGKIMGLNMTPADKGDEFVPDLNYNQVTFLKRGFVRDEEYPFLVHPTMDLSEIYESMRWTRNPSATAEHMRSLAEMVWHHGREEYQKFVDTVRSVPIGRSFHIPAYDVMRKKWLDLF